MVPRRLGGILSSAGKTWPLFPLADVRLAKSHHRESRKSAHACIICRRSVMYSARLYAERTLFLSTCASWRSITSERAPDCILTDRASPPPLPRKDVRLRPIDAPHLLQHSNGLPRQRNHMLPPHLHPLGWYQPHPLFPIDLIPCSKT